MRTIPKELARFREIVEERGKQLRALSYTDIVSLSLPPEDLMVDSRKAIIAVIVEPVEEGLRVVVQGFMDAKWIGKNVALDGFYIHRDGSIHPMPDDEFFRYD
jgi:hypothetical protein